MIKKNPQKVGIEGIYLNIIKAIYEKPIASIIFNGEKLKAFPVRSRARQGWVDKDVHSHHYSTYFGNPRYSNQRRKRSKGNANWIADNMIVHIEDPKDGTRKLLEFSSECGKAASYKINTQKSVAFLYTNNKRWEREIKEEITFTAASYLRRQKTYTSKTVGCWGKKSKKT